MSVFRNISVVITGDAAPLVRAYGEAASATQAFAREQTAAADASTALNRSMSGLAAKIRDVSAAAAASSANTARWSESSAAARANVDRLARTAETAGAGVRAYRDAVAPAAAETAALRTAATQAATRVARLGEAAGLAAPETTALGAAAGEAAAGTAALGAGSQAAAAGAARVAASSAAAAAGAADLGAAGAAGAAGVGALSRTTSDAERIAGRLGGSLGLAGAQAGTMGAQITSAATAASRAGQAMSLAGQVGAATLAIGLIASVAAAAKFDAEMHNVASIDSTVRDNFAATESQILSLSRTLPQSAQTLAEGLYNIASSGFYGANAMEILGVSAKAASAGLTTTNTASKAIVASLNAYGLGADSATRVSDALFQTVNYGVISFEALTSAVANSVGNAAQAKVGIEQLGAALATMTLSGMSASSAGVSLNNLLSKLIKPSDALSQEFAKLNITQADLSDTGTGLYGVMMKLNDSGDANLQTWLKWFPEIRAVRGALALVAGDGANYTRIIGLMGTAQENAGATQRVFNEQMKSTSAQLDLMKNKIEATGISIGASLLPFLNQGLAGLTKFLGGVKDVGAEVLGDVEPGLRALAQSIGNVAEIAHSVHLDELAAELARLGLSVVVGGFDALAVALQTTTGFLGGNRAAVLALALAWGAFKAEVIATSVATLATRLAALATALASSVTYLPTAIQLWFQYRLANDAAAAGTTVLRTALASAGTALGALGVVLAALVVSYRLMDEEQERVHQGLQKVNASIDPTNLDTLRSALTQLTAQQQAYSASVDGMLTQDASVRKNRKDAADDIKNVSDALKTGIDTAKSLAAEYGLTESAVENLATAYGVDLTQGLQKVDGPGAKFTQLLDDAKTKARAAGIDTADMSKAMDALAKSTDGAKEALQSFNDTLGLLQGNGIAVIEAQDNFAASLVTLKTQLASNKEGLIGNSDAAIANRKAYLDALSAAGAYGSALSTYTGDASTAQSATGALTDQVAQTAVQSGVAAGQVQQLGGAIDETTGSAKDLAAVGGISIPVDAPGAASTKDSIEQLAQKLPTLPKSVQIDMLIDGVPDALGDMDAMNGVISRLPKFARIDVSTPGALQAMSELDQTSGILSRIPPSVSTTVSAPGAVQAATEVGGVSAKVDALPAAKATNISAPGATSATDLVWTFYLTTGKLPPAKWTQISAPGATASTGQTQQFIDTVAAMVASKATNISAPGATAAKGEVDALRAAVDALHDKSITVTTVQRQIIEQAYYTASSPGSPALTYGLQGAATGGEIRGPGTATSDSILARLSDREWVIQAASAAKYGHAAMASINAGTATVIPGPTAGYALGGQVSAVSPPGFASGGLVSGGGYGGMTLSVGGISIQVVGGPSNADTARAVEDGVQRALGRVVSHIRAGVG